MTKSALRWDGDAFNMVQSKASLKIRWLRRWMGIIPVEKQRNHSTGIDPGSESRVTTSDGKKLLSPKPFKPFKKKLKNNQKRLSKFKSTGENRNTSRIKVAEIHSKNISNDFHHQLSTQLIREHQAIIIEGLNIKSMLKNKRYAKGTSDAGWRQLLPFLKYTCDCCERNIVELPQIFPIYNDVPYAGTM